MKLDRTREVLTHDKHKEIEAAQRKATSARDAVQGEWLRTLPFAGTGMSNPRISLGEIYNFAVSVMALDPAPGDWILDLGAGSCWVSEWLTRMLMHTVSLDISPDMLRIGQQRLGPGAPLTAGDFESLPFAADSFDRVVCISALHHVPDIPRALREIQRVLKDDGVAVFSEPGRGHADSPQSRTEMQELGVLERDVVAGELMDECLRAGFRRVSVHPYIFPLPAYSPEDWHNLRACQEPWPVITGLEARLGWQSLVTLRDAIEGHPVIVARKNEPRIDSRRPGILRAKIGVISAPQQVAPGETFTIEASVHNSGDTLWLAQPTPIGGFVALGAKLVDTNNQLLIHDYGLAYLARELAPGESTTVEVSLRAPDKAGMYRVKLDMVDECIAWFEHLGSPPALVPLDVAGALQWQNEGKGRGRS